MVVSGGGSVSISCCEGADLDEVVSEDAVSAPGSRPDALRGVLTAAAAIWERLSSSNDVEASDARDEFDELIAPQLRPCALEASCRGKWRRDRLFERCAARAGALQPRHVLRFSSVSVASCGCDAAFAGLAACHCGKCHRSFADRPAYDAHTVELGNSAQEVLRTRDPEKAAGIREQDDAMDDPHRQLFTVLMDREWKHGIPAAVDVALLGRFYERFADHAVEVGRRVVFQATGTLPLNKKWGLTRQPARPPQQEAATALLRAKGHDQASLRGEEPVVPVVAVIQRTATVVAGVKEEEEG